MVFKVSELESQFVEFLFLLLIDREFGGRDAWGLLGLVWWANDGLIYPCARCLDYRLSLNLSDSLVELLYKFLGKGASLHQVILDLLV